jgi:hypothetical protein
MLDTKKEIDTREVIQVELTEHEFFLLAKMAHELDMTLNKFVEKILLDFLEKECNNG